MATWQHGNTAACAPCGVTGVANRPTNVRFLSFSAARETWKVLRCAAASKGQRCKAQAELLQGGSSEWRAGTHDLYAIPKIVEAAAEEGVNDGCGGRCHEPGKHPGLHHHGSAPAPAPRIILRTVRSTVVLSILHEAPNPRCRAAGIPMIWESLVDQPPQLLHRCTPSPTAIDRRGPVVGWWSWVLLTRAQRYTIIGELQQLLYFSFLSPRLAL